MAIAVYVLGALVTLLCAVLLLRAWRKTGHRLLLWSGICFAGLTLANVVLFLDLVVFPDVDMYRLRLGIAAASMCSLLYGLVWESDG